MVVRRKNAPVKWRARRKGLREGAETLAETIGRVNAPNEGEKWPYGEVRLGEANCLLSHDQALSERNKRRERDREKGEVRRASARKELNEKGREGERKYIVCP